MTPYVAPAAISRLFRPLCGVVLILTLCPLPSGIVTLALLQVIVMSMARPLVCRLLSAGATARPGLIWYPLTICLAASTEAAHLHLRRHVNQCAASRS